MTTLKAQKVEDVQFTISHTNNGLTIDLVLEEGGLYLSLSGLFLTNGKIWYGLPISTLENITVLSEEPPKLKFSIPTMEIIVSGKHADKLLALRHFLLPYIGGPRKKRVRLDDLLKFWALGIMDPNILAKLLGVERGQIDKMLKEIKKKGLIDKKGKLTKSAVELFSRKEMAILSKLGVEDG